MTFIDLLSDPSDQANQYFTLLQALDAIAKQAIDAPMLQRDELDQVFSQTLYHYPFDYLSPGLLVAERPSSSTEKLFNKPPRLNLIFADLYTAAAQGLFNGAFKQQSRQILDHYLAMFNSGATIGLDETRLSYQQKLISEEVAKDVLTDQELALFYALGKVLGEGYYCQKQSLTDAAKSLAMPIKQAQILEHSMRQKLLHQAITKTHTLVFLAEDYCQLILSLCRSSFYDPNDDYSRLAKKLLDSLFVRDLKDKLLIESLYAALYYLQLDFDEHLSQQLVKRWHGSDLSDSLKQTLTSEVASIDAFVDYFIHGTTGIAKEQVEIIQLDKNRLKDISQRQVYQSAFRAWRFVFSR